MKKLFTLKNLKQKKWRLNHLFFLLIAVLGMNPLTAQIENLPCNGFQLVDSELTGLVITSNPATSWSNENSVIDGNSNSYATGVIGGILPRYINIRDHNNTYPAGTPIGFNVRLRGLLSAGTITVSTFLENVAQESQDFSAGSLLGSGGRFDVGFTTTESFDAIRVQYSGTAVSFDVFYAYINHFCPGEELACNTITPLQRTDFPVVVNEDRTGTSGIALSAILNTQNLISPNEDDYAEIQSVLNVGGSASVSVQNVLDTYPAGSYAGFEIQNMTLLSLDLLSNFRINTYLDDELQETITGDNLILNLPLLEASSRGYIGFITNLAFDEIQLVRTQPFDLNLGTLRIYNAVANLPCEGPDLTCNQPTRMTTPSYPVSIGSGIGISGIGCVGCSIDNAWNVLEEDPNSYANITLTAGIEASASIAVEKSLTPWQGGSFAGFEISNADLLDLDVASVFSVITYLDGELQENSTALNLVMSESNLLNGDGHRIIGFETSEDYDMVELRINQVLGLDLGATQVYNLIIQEFCEIPDLECNVYTSVSTPEFPAFVNDLNTGFSGGVCLACAISDPENVIDNDEDSFATLSFTAGVFNAGSISIKMGGEGNYIEGGNYAGFIVENPNLLDVSVLGGIQISTYLEGNPVENFDASGVVVSVDTDLITNPGRFQVGFVSTEGEAGDFDEVQITFTQLVDVALNEIRVYDFILSAVCPATIDCNASYYLTRPDFPVVINAQRTGLSDLACVGAIVQDAENVIDDNLENFAEINFLAGAGCTGSISVMDPTATYPAGSYAGFTIHDNEFLLQADLFESINIRTYLDGNLQESGNGADLLDLSLIVPILGTGTFNIGFFTTAPFDEIQIEVSSLESVSNSIHVYGVFVDTRSSFGDSFSCCTAGPTLSGVAPNTFIGITTLDRNTSGEWVENTRSGFLKLESASLPFVPTRLSIEQRDLLTPVEGMLVWNTDLNCLEFYDGDQWVCGEDRCINNQ